MFSTIKARNQYFHRWKNRLSKFTIVGLYNWNPFLVMNFFQTNYICIPNLRDGRWQERAIKQSIHISWNVCCVVFGLQFFCFRFVVDKIFYMHCSPRVNALHFQLRLYIASYFNLQLLGWEILRMHIKMNLQSAHPSTKSIIH